MKSDSGGDLIQLAAYAVIIIVMGVVALMKKVAEQRKKRRWLTQQTALKHLQPTAGKGLHLESEETAVKKEPVEPVLTEPAPQSAPPLTSPFPSGERNGEDGEKEKRVPTEIEDVLREALGLPPLEHAKPRPGTIESKPPAPGQQVESKPETASEFAPVVTLAEASVLAPTLPETNSTESVYESGELRWQNLIDTLNAQELNPLQQAIIFSEVIRRPIALRQRRGQLGS